MNTPEDENYEPDLDDLKYFSGQDINDPKATRIVVQIIKENKHNLGSVAKKICYDWLCWLAKEPEYLKSEWIIFLLCDEYIKIHPLKKNEIIWHLEAWKHRE